MRLSFLILSFILAFNVKAQYFQHIYGGARTQLSSGENIHNSPQVSHLMGGVQTNNDLVVTATDAQGGFGTPILNFNKTYHVTDPSGIQLMLHGTQVFELQGAAGIYGVVALGEIPGSNTPGIVYFQLDNAGNVVGLANQYICTAGTNWTVSLVTNAMQASNGDIYIVGSVVDPVPNGQGHAFIFSIRASGALHFVVNEIGGLGQNTYVRPDAIVENPWANQLILAGVLHDLNGSQYGFFMPVDQTTLVCNRSEIYGNYTYDCALTGIDVANNPAPNGTGFVMSGWTTKGNSGTDMWLIKVDQTGQNVDWSYQYDYHTGNGSSEIAFDVKERLNTMGLYEYYLAGYTDHGVYGNTDALVLKIDDLGSPVPNGEFTYGAGSIEEVAKRIDLFDGTGYDGISVYASEYDPTTTRSDMFLIKAYFNGYTACNYHLDNPITISGPPHDRAADMLWYAGVSSNPLTINSFITKDAQLCYSTTVAAGDNTVMPMSQGTDNLNSSNIMPNPLNGDSDHIVVEYNATEKIEARISIYDMLGKLHVSQQVHLSIGKNTIDMDISHLDFAQGVYTLKIIGQGIQENHTVLVD